jgi:hypothetical protein
MAAYTSTQSGNFSNVSTWGGGGYPDTNADTFTIVAGHTVTYDVTTALTVGLGACVINAGGTLVFNANTQIRFNGNFTSSGNFYCKQPGVKIFLKGTTSPDNIFSLNNITQLTTTGTGVSGLSTVSVGSTVGITTGIKLSGTGIRTNSKVISISGSVLTLDRTNSGTVSGTLTFGNRVELIGSEGMPITTLTAGITTTSGYNQGYLSVASTSNFAVNDWIAVYKRDVPDETGVVGILTGRNDEGFIIHDIDNSNLYIREFVGPTASITGIDTTSNQITVSNSKVFRTWQNLIFGTESNRNISSITSINNVNNIISLGSTITGTVSVGTTVYTTGPLQTKDIGDRVRKCATTVITEATSTATQISIASTAGFNVGDEILIDSRYLSASDTTNYDDERPNKRNITAISGNTITLNTSLGYISRVGAFVVRLTRDVKVIGDYETTLVTNAAHGCSVGDVLTQAFSGARGVVKTVTNTTTVVIQDIFGNFITGSTNSPWLSRNGTPIATNVFCSTVTLSTTQGHAAFAFNRTNFNNANHLGIMYFRDVECTNFSNANSSSSRLWIRGQWSSENYWNGGVEIEGVTWATPSQTDNFVFSTRRMQFQRFMNDATMRCCTVWNTEGGYQIEEGYNIQNFGLFNNYSSRGETFGMLLGHCVGGAWEVSHNYIHRCDDIGMNISVARYGGRGVHHNWLNVIQGRALSTDSTYGNVYLLRQNRIENYFNPVATHGGAGSILISNEFIPGFETFDFYNDGGFQNSNFGTGYPPGITITSLEHNYIEDAVTVYIANGVRNWDDSEKAWRCFFDNDASIEAGLSEIYYVPANSTFIAKGTIKLDPAFNGTAPRFEIRSIIDRFYFGANESFAGEQPYEGFLVSSNFSAANLTSYQSVTLTLSPKPWGRNITVGIINTNANASEGWWEKPIEIKYDNLPSTPFLQTGINNFSSTISSGSDFTSRKLRLGGSVI